MLLLLMLLQRQTAMLLKQTAMMLRQAVSLVRQAAESRNADEAASSAGSMLHCILLI